MATLSAVAVVHLLVRLEMLSPQVKSGPPWGSHLWLRPQPALWEKVARTWSALGTADPYWSVITNDRYKIAHMSRSGAIDEFYETGWNELSRLTAWLDRSGCSVSGDATCVDYGCGVGRATLWLARTFKRVIAVDVSESHLKAAQDYLGRQGIKNVEFHLLRSEQDLERVKGADVFFSVIVDDRTYLAAGT